MKTREELVRLSDRLEMKVKELESEKLYTLREEFYRLNSTEQVDFLKKMKGLQEEVDTLKKEVDKVESDYKELKGKYGRVIQDGDLWLGDVLEIEKPEYGSNNLILAPVGSGKSYAIFNQLAKGGSAYQLMLVPSRHLKNSVAPTNNSIRLEDGNNVFTSGNKDNFGGNGYQIHVMTYSEFGWRIRNNDNFVDDNNIEQIYCDEIHSLVEYKTYNGDEALVHAMKYLFLAHENITKYYFTATTEHLVSLNNVDPDRLANIKVFNYLNYPNIKKYTALSKYEINHIEQLREHLQAHSGDFVAYGYKGLAYHDRISGQMKIAEMLEEEGFRPLVLWSTASEFEEMSEEQLRALDYIIETGDIPAGYDFLVINGAMREGWNLTDDRVELVVVNSISETNQVQVRGRSRKNIATLIVRTGSTKTIAEEVVVPEEYLNTWLTASKKRDLSNTLGLLNTAGKITQFTGLREILISNGYKIEDSREMIDGKRKRVSTITK